MILKVFAVYDSKAQAFLQPFFAPNAGVACRMFETAVKQEGSQFGRFAGDYELFELGTFDDSFGDLAPAEHRVSLGLAVTFLNVKG